MAASALNPDTHAHWDKDVAGTAAGAEFSGQGVQAESPVALPYWPAGQASQALAPSLAAKYPRAQGWQATVGVGVFVEI